MLSCDAHSIFHTFLIFPMFQASGLKAVTLQEAKVLLKDDDDLIIAVYDYWLNKRLRLAHALIPQVRAVMLALHCHCRLQALLCYEWLWWIWWWFSCVVWLICGLEALWLFPLVFCCIFQIVEIFKLIF